MVVATQTESLLDFIKRVKVHLALTGYHYIIGVFNDVSLTISYDSKSDDLVTIYKLKRNLLSIG